LLLLLIAFGQLPCRVVISRTRSRSGPPESAQAVATAAASFGWRAEPCSSHTKTPGGSWPPGVEVPIGGAS
jgi:hypothetical protein